MRTAGVAHRRDAELGHDRHPAGLSRSRAGGYTPYEASTRTELLTLFDKNVAEARASIAGCSDETFMKMWSLKRGDATLMTLPKIAVVRSFVMNHVIHHRGQLSVYLRELNVPVPSIYGPSADEAAWDNRSATESESTSWGVEVRAIIRRQQTLKCERTIFRG
jgi:hypothetical protein